MRSLREGQHWQARQLILEAAGLDDAGSGGSSRRIATMHEPPGFRGRSSLSATRTRIQTAKAVTYCEPAGPLRGSHRHSSEAAPAASAMRSRTPPVSDASGMPSAQHTACRFFRLVGTRRCRCAYMIATQIAAEVVQTLPVRWTMQSLACCHCRARGVCGQQYVEACSENV